MISRNNSEFRSTKPRKKRAGGPDSTRGADPKAKAKTGKPQSRKERAGGPDSTRDAGGKAKVTRKKPVRRAST